ncbi:D-malate degradation protein R [Serratia proteamaculans]|nr:D-malate degradation protein R [Serratia proteamaculans]
MSLPFDVHRLLPAFLAAAQAQNFSAAARQLGVTPAAISKNIRVLEEKLALRLFQRNTHNVVLTDEGKALLQQVAPLWQALSATLETAGSAQQAPSGTVRVSMIPGFGRQMLMPLIPQFLERYPQIDLDLSLDARVVNLVGEGFDVGIGSRVDPDSRLVARPLYPMQMVLAASPGYLAQHGMPQDPQDLLRHNCLLHRNPATGRSVKWPLQQHGEAKTLEHLWPPGRQPTRDAAGCGVSRAGDRLSGALVCGTSFCTRHATARAGGLLAAANPAVVVLCLRRFAATGTRLG